MNRRCHQALLLTKAGFHRFGWAHPGEHGIEGIEPSLRQGLNAWNKCDELLEKLPLFKKTSAGGDKAEL